jgi:hypothetical protein
VKDQDAEHAPTANLVPTQPAARRKRGPHTAAGKRRVALNPVKHGLSARSVIVPGFERVSDWETHYEGFRHALKPTDANEESLVRLIAELAWRQRRVIRFETGLFDVGGTDGLAGARPAERWWLASSGGLDQLIRYEAHLLRQLHRASADLRAYRDRTAPAVVVEVAPAPDTEQREP